MTLYMMQIINMQWSIYVVYVKPLADSLQTVDITDFLTMIVWHGRFLLSEFLGNSDRPEDCGNGITNNGQKMRPHSVVLCGRQTVEKVCRGADFFI